MLRRILLSVTQNTEKLYSKPRGIFEKVHVGLAVLAHCQVRHLTRWGIKGSVSSENFCKTVPREPGLFSALFKTLLETPGNLLSIDHDFCPPEKSVHMYNHFKNDTKISLTCPSKNLNQDGIPT